MAENPEQQTLVKAVKIATFQDGISFVHDYGEKYFKWDSISHIFGLIFEKKNTPNLPLCLFLSRDSQSFYYIDGNTTQMRDINGETSQKVQFQSAVELRKAKEEDLKKIIHAICIRSTKIYIDKPLVGYLKGSKAFLPSFTKLRDITDYCRRVMESLKESDFLGAQVLQPQDEIPKISLARKEREEWKEGSIIEGRFTVQQIFRGAMGTVYIVFDPETVKFYAMKTFQERHVWDEFVIRRFIMEAEIWVKLGRHPNIVQAVLVKEIEGKHYIFLEYIQGTDLEKLLKKGPLPLVRAIDFAIQFCSGMDYAYKKLGLIHRDIKPANCMITREGILKITDFGLGKIFKGSQAEGDMVAIPQQAKDKGTPASATTMVGTIPYMAPELFSDFTSASIRSDIYAAGIVFYEMVTGINPFIDDDPGEVIINQIELDPEDPSSINPEIPQTYSNLVCRCLDKIPEYRYDNFEQIQSELEKIYRELAGQPYEPPESDEAFSEEDWINMGQSLASLGRHKEAVITFDQAIHLNRASLNAWICKSASLIELGRIEEAYSILKKALTFNPNDWRIYYSMGEAQWKAGNLNNALSCLDAGLRQVGEMPHLLGRKAQLLGVARKFEAALSTYDKALEKNPRSAEIWDGKASILIEMHRYEEAIECLKNALEINPRLEPAWYHRGIALFNVGIFGGAVSSMKKAIDLDPNFANPWLYIGNCYRESGERKNAIEAYRSALQINPNNAEAYISIASLLKEEGKFEEALDMIEESLKTTPQNVELLFQRAEIVLSLGYYDECQALCNAIRKINPDHEDSLLLSNTVTKRLKEKEVLLETINSLSGLEKEFVLNDVNSLLSVFCNVKDALSYLECISQEPKINYLKACLYFTEGDTENYGKYLKEALQVPETQEAAMRLKEFVEQLQESERQAPEKKQKLIETLYKKKDQSAKGRTPELLLLDGLEKLKKNKGKEARDSFKMALSLDPHMTVCGYFIGKTIELTGDMKSALIAYNEFINNFPNSTGYWKEMLVTQNIKQDQDFEKVYHRSIAVFPHFHQYWISYLLYLAEKNYTEKARVIASHLLRNFEKQLDIPKDKALFWNVKGLLQLFLMRYRKAVQSFKEALIRDENDFTALTGILTCYTKINQPEHAMPFIEKLKALDKNTGLSDYFLSELLMTQRSDEDPLSAIEAGLRKNPTNMLLLMRKARTLIEMEDLEGFFAVYNKMSSINRDYNPIIMLYVIVLVDNQKVYDAIPELSRIISREPINLAAQKNLGFSYLYLNQAPKAIKAFESILDIYDSDYEMHMGKGIAHYAMGEYKMAYDSFIHAINLCTYDPDLWQFMGAVNFILGNYSESEKCWDRALRYRSGFLTAWINKGYFFYYVQKYNQAIELANRTIRINQQNVSAWILRALCQWKMGRLSEALQSIEKGIAISPDNLKAWVVRGVLEFYNKNFEVSHQSFEKATTLESKNAKIWYDRALAALFLNNQADTRKSLERCSVLNPNFFEGIIARYTIERESFADGPAKALYAQAQQVNPERFHIWAESLKSTRNPRDLLKPVEILGDPFSLSFNRPLVRREPLEPFHYLSIRELFTKNSPLL